MKKIIALVLAVVLTMSLGVMAFGANRWLDSSDGIDYSGKDVEIDVTAVALQGDSILVPLYDENGDIYDTKSAFEDDYRFSYTVRKGQVSSVAVTTEKIKNSAVYLGKQPYVKIKLKDTYSPTTMYDLEVVLKFTAKTSGNGTTTEYTVTGSDITYNEYVGDALSLDMTAVNRLIVDYSDYKDTKEEYDISGDMFEITYKAVESGKKVWVYNQNTNADIVAAYLDADMTFHNFPSKTKLAANADVTLFSDLNIDEEQYLYTIVDGKLAAAPAGAKYDADQNAWKFKANTLGSYVIMNKEVAVGSASSDASGDKDNVDTGVSGTLNIAVVAAVVSLAAAGAVALKK